MKTYAQTLAILLVAVTCICNKGAAQELELKSFGETNEVMTVPMQREDLNHEICALVKVQLPVEGCGFEGSVIGTPVYNINEYWVYMPKGSKQLQVKCPNCYTMMIDFVENGKQVQLQSKRVYKLVLDVPAGLFGGTSIEDELNKALKPAREMYDNGDYERAHQEFQKIKDTWADRGWTNAGLDDWLNRCAVAQTFKRLGVTTYYPKKEGMYKVSSEKGYGFVDSIGNVVVEPQYYDARDFVDGVAIIAVIEMQQPYKRMNWMIESYPMYGLIDKKGKNVVSPHLQDITDSHTGVVWVRDWNDKWGIIDKSGKYIVKPQYSSVSINHNGRYSAVKNKGRWGLIDCNTGKVTIACTYSDLYHLENYYAFIDAGQKRIFIDNKTGKERFALSSDTKYIKPVNDEANKYAIISKEGRYGLIDDNGFEVLAPEYLEIKSNSLFRNLVTVTSYNIIALFDLENLALTTMETGEYFPVKIHILDEKFGILDLREEKDYFCVVDLTTGKQVSPLLLNISENSWAYPPILLKEGNEYTIFGEDGSIYDVPRTSIAPEFSYGRARIQQDGKYGYIDEKGCMVIPCEFDYAEPFAYNGNVVTAKVRKDGKEMQIDANGTVIY